MVTSSCKHCKKQIKRAGYKVGVFCSLECKGKWQTAQKPVTKEWLYQKYFIEKLSIYKIAKIVKRNAKNVWRWLNDFGFKLRENNKNLITDKRFWDKGWLSHEYSKTSAIEIANNCGVHVNAIYFWLHKHKIKTRNISETRKIKKWGLYGDKNGMYGKIGPLNPRWMGGITPERQLFYQSLEWKGVSKKVWKRDRGTCQKCGCECSKLGNIHHIVSFRIRYLRCDDRNLILVCKECHHWIHSKKNTNKELILTYEQFKQLYQ